MTTLELIHALQALLPEAAHLEVTMMPQGEPVHEALLQVMREEDGTYTQTVGLNGKPA